MPGLFFFIFVFSTVQLVHKILPMSGFEPRISGVVSNQLSHNHCPTDEDLRTMLSEEKLNQE